jgi:hypothetical protein
MANKYDAAALAANADKLEALAATARSNMLQRTTDKATRLGAEGERIAREAKAAETQRVEAEALVKSHLADAATYDARAASLEQQAAATTDAHDATELREDAAKQRQGAEVARARSQIASDDAQRLANEAAGLRTREQAIDAELADMGGRLQASEMAVDNLEWHAERARTMADTVGRADDLQRQANEATSRGDTAAASTLSQRAASLRDDADAMAFVRGQPPFVLDQRALADLGVELEPGTLDVPMPELIDPTSPFGPLASTGPGAVDDAALAGDAVAVAATDDVLGLSDAEPVLAATSEPGDTASDAAADVDADGSGFGEELEGTFDAPTFDTPTFEPDPLGGGEMVASADFGDTGSLDDEPIESAFFGGGDDGAADTFA